MDLTSLFYPKKCLECSKKGNYLCINCLELLPKVKPICPGCKRYSIRGKTHRNCKNKTSLDGLISIWPYKKIIRKALISLKYRFAFQISKELAENSSRKILVDKIFENYKNITLIPIPSYRIRQNWRGFNQAELIGKGIAERLNWNFIPNLLVKTKKTKPQTELKRFQRQKNIAGSFAVNKKYNLKDLRNIIIFDDVITTGSTISHAAETTKDQTGGRVWGMTIAR